MKFSATNRGKRAAFSLGHRHRTQNAATNIREAIARVQPERVISAGFAGGLNLRAQIGTLSSMSRTSTPVLRANLRSWGRSRRSLLPSARGHSPRPKNAPSEETAADAVEMESSVIRTICREFKIPSATVRVISDDARQDLPLDFNALMTSEDRINYLKLIWAVLSHPGRIPKFDCVPASKLWTRRENWAPCWKNLLRAERC